MSAALGAFAFDLINNLISSAVQKLLDDSVTDFFERRRIQNRIGNAVADVVQPLLPFLTNEKIPEEQQRRLIETCVAELAPLSREPARLFQGSLNGQRIFEDLYALRPLPTEVLEDGTKDIYVLLFPRIAELLCKVPAAVKEWETLAWTEEYRRLDDLARELRALFLAVDQLQAQPQRQADATLSRIRRSVMQKISLKMDITGLRADQPLAEHLSEFFVHPEIIEDVEPQKRTPSIIANAPDCLACFLRPHRNFIVTGVAGAGKSTWTKWLQRETLGSSWPGLGVRIELRDCRVNALPSLQELVRATAGTHYAEELTAPVIARWLDQQLLFFILDGFDEVRLEERDAVYAWIADLYGAARGCPVILTSRPLTTDHLQRRDVFAAAWSISAFDMPRIVEYIDKWHVHMPLLAEADRIVDAERLAAQWQADSTLKPLTSNPLLLSTLLLVHHLDGRLPSGRARLYQRYVEGMLGVWDDRRHLVTSNVQLTVIQKRQILRGLALHMFLEEREQMDEEPLLTWLEGHLKKNNILTPPADVLTLLRERTGLLIGPGVYTFAHKSIAEFLMAEVAWEGDQIDYFGQRIDRMYLFDERDNDRWNTVTFLWAGLASVADVVTYIDHCLDVGNFSLGYGILYDQFDRVDRITRRRLLLSERPTAVEPSFERSGTSFVFYCPAPEFREGLYYKIPLPLLRALSPGVNLQLLIDLALDSRTLTFEDRTAAKVEVINDFVWLHNDHFAAESRAQLANVINAPHPVFQISDDWHVYVTYRVVSSAIYGSRPLESTLLLVRSVLPHYTGILPLMLMSMFVDLCDRLRLGPYQAQAEAIIGAILGVNSDEVDAAWLVGTEYWRDRFENIVFDLLESFAQSLHNYRVENRGIDPFLLEQAKEYIEELRARRTVLAQQQQQ
jgi:hypothetical protein